MLIVAIHGGLGNQMFQYAFGYSLQKTSETILLLDTTIFDERRIHNGFELDRLFSIQTPIATYDEIRNLIGWRATQLGREIMARKRYRRLRGRNYFQEESSTYDEKVFSLSSNCYLTGYWQSQKYFFPHEQDIRDCYRFRQPMTEKNKIISEQITKCNSISIHIRRGDTLTKGIMAKLSSEYYNKAIKYITERVENTVFFVFSDDIQWVKNNIAISDGNFFLDHNTKLDSYNDMRLMSLCKHNIIANSSFSWWGAWLNRNDNKIVVAPRYWFSEDTLDSTNLIPDTWNLL